MRNWQRNAGEESPVGGANVPSTVTSCAGAAETAWATTTGWTVLEFQLDGETLGTAEGAGLDRSVQQGIGTAGVFATIRSIALSRVIWAQRPHGPLGAPVWRHPANSGTNPASTTRTSTSETNLPRQTISAIATLYPATHTKL